MLRCASQRSVCTSVEPHQIITKRSTPCSALKRFISWTRSMARSYFVAADFTWGASRLCTQALSNTASMGLIASSCALSGSKSSFLSTAERLQTSYTFSPCTSQPPKTKSLSGAKGTKSLISGERPSVRFPSRMVPICVTLPIGFPWPRNTSKTPAIKVLDTAPKPGMSTPSFPLAGLIFTPFFVILSCLFQKLNLPFASRKNSLHSLCVQKLCRISLIRF